MARQSIDDLIDKPLNELTEEEAQIVIEWKAQSAFNDYKVSESHKEAIRMMEEQTKIEQKKLEASLETLDTLKERALAFYEAQ